MARPEKQHLHRIETDGRDATGFVPSARKEARATELQRDAVCRALDLLFKRSDLYCRFEVSLKGKMIRIKHAGEDRTETV